MKNEADHFADDVDRAVDAHERKDYKTADKLWLPLAEQGNAEAQHRLGNLYDDGKGVPKNYKEAIKWFRRSAQQGNTGAQTPNPVFVKLMQYVREQGVSRENIRDVMGSIQTIGQEYRSAADRSSFKPSDDAVKNLSDAGLSDESILIIVEIIKAL